MAGRDRNLLSHAHAVGAYKRSCSSSNKCRETGIHEIGQEHLGAIRALMEQYARLPMDLADASLVLAATQLGEGRILSTDRRDFDTYRWKDTEPFHNLLDG